MSDDCKDRGLEGIAVVGMACRFPGAANIDAYWDLLREGVESISFFSEEELVEVDEFIRSKPNFVGAQGVLAHVDRFDAALFGLTPREAEIMDPQQRFFLEVSWQALEHAGYNPESHGASMAVFAGMDTSQYGNLVRRVPGLEDSAGGLQLLIGNDKDHLAPRLSYLLNLRGPSVPVQTACSTSLVAIHLACQSLLHFECDSALAGGCAIPVPVKGGYLYEEGGALSPDGHCRAFDAAAKGTALGSGVGVVLLKRIEDALADRDTIQAVIRASAINNDGAAKVGYTAPSVEGQKRVIREALELAEVEPREVSYVETHGTGTTLGDPIEIEALRQAFGNEDTREKTCAIGSVKTNLGHCNSAAGVAGLIKTILCLRHRTLVPSLSFQQPNPKLELERGPFYVQRRTAPWRGEHLIAGVSSFGIGGTNAHMILEQAPPVEPAAPSGRADLLTLSAKTETALATRAAELASFLEASPTLSLPDLAYTFNLGRKPLEKRRALAFSDRDTLLTALAQTGPAISDRTRAGVVFMFPGQGADYQDLGRDLYRDEPLFRERVDACCALLEPLLGLDLADYLFAEDEAARARLRRPDLWQPALFVVEYALAQWWISQGIRPQAMIGHSIGEYVAAALAGVFSLEDALRLIARRGAATAEIEPGAMLAVVAAEDRVAGFLGEAIDLAAVNGPSLCVLSGPSAAIDSVEDALKRDGLHTIRLATTHAFHSHMMEPLVGPLTELAGRFELNAPQIPLISNLSGTWMTAAEARDPSYWGRHLRMPVRFKAGLETLNEEGCVLLEVGPGKVLAQLAQRHPGLDLAALPSMTPGISVSLSVIEAMGGLWCHGVALDWDAFYEGEQRGRIPAPTYPFEGRSYWPIAEVSPSPAAASGIEVRKDLADWFYLPTWKQAPLVRARPLRDHLEPGMSWLLFMDEPGFSEHLAARLETLQQKVIRVHLGRALAHDGEHNYRLDPTDAAGYETLLADLAQAEHLPDHIIHAWRIDRGESGLEHMETHLHQGFDSVIRLAQALAGLHPDRPVHMGILTNHMQRIAGDKGLVPEKATMLGAAWVIPKEFPGMTCKCIDVEAGELAPSDRLVDAVLSEWIRRDQDKVVAYRDHDRGRWLPLYDPIHLDEAGAGRPFREKGVFLITHGLQEIGFALAEHLARVADAFIVLADRTFFPPAEEWESWIEQQGAEDFISRKIARVRELIDQGARVRVRTADPADPDSMARLKREIQQDLGGPHGLIHLETATQSGLIQGKSPTTVSKVLATKMREAMVLTDCFDELDFFVFFAENAAEGGIGKVEQGAAHAFLAHFARDQAEKRDYPVFTVEWGTRQWRESTEEALRVTPHIQQQLDEKRRRYGMTRDQCIAALERVLGLEVPHIVVSTRDYRSVLEQQDQFNTTFFQTQMQESGDDARPVHPRPDLPNPYQAPGSEVEKMIADAWQTYFGIDKIGVQDNFFELGGHSLLAVQLLAKLNDSFATKLTLKHIFDAPTISELAALTSRQEVEVEDAEDLTDLLAEIEGLSEEQIHQALASESKS